MGKAVELLDWGADFSPDRAVRNREGQVGMTKKISLICPQCGAEFTDYKTNDRKYCSARCRDDVHMWHPTEGSPHGLSPLHVDRFWANVDKSSNPDGCWPWIGTKDRNGYGLFFAGGRGKSTFAAHRLAYELAHNVELDGHLCACHSCDNPPCCRPGHLWSGTKADNLKDMAKKGRSQQGERNRQAKLSDQAVIEIYLTEGVTHRVLAECHGISQSQISEIRADKAWKSVTTGLSRGRNG